MSNLQENIKTGTDSNQHIIFENDHLFHLDVLLQSLGYEVCYSHNGAVRKMKGYYNPNTGENITLGEGRD